jgi:hypothetical protein
MRKVVNQKQYTAVLHVHAWLFGTFLHLLVYSWQRSVGYMDAHGINVHTAMPGPLIYPCLKTEARRAAPPIAEHRKQLP